MYFKETLLFTSNYNLLSYVLLFFFGTLMHYVPEV